MTHSAIIAHVYANFCTYQGMSRELTAGMEGLGAFVFLPGEKLHWVWWKMQEIRDYMLEGGLDGGKILEELETFDVAEEFLVLIIEYVDGPGNQQAHFHRMSKTPLN